VSTSPKPGAGGLLPAIIAFAGHAVAVEDSRPLPERIVAGDPAQRTWNHYSDPTGQFHAGIWQGEAGAWRVQYAAQEEELCTLLEGRVRLTGADGTVCEFAAGASFVVPGGFVGIWENIGRVRKVYALGTLRAEPAHPADDGVPPAG
jgi:uncharacterized cupin superfamily protein